MIDANKTAKHVAIRIRNLRGTETQKDFAKKLGVSPQAVSDWENAVKMPRMGVIEKLSELYNVPKSYIIGEGSYIPEPKKPVLFQNGQILVMSDLPEDAVREVESYLSYIRSKYNLS